MKTIKIIISCFLLLLSLIVKAQVTLVPFASGFSNNPTDIKNAGDDRVFVVEQNGYIRIVDTSGTVNPKPFLDIHTIVGSVNGEQGLLGLAFSPAYATDGRFYVNYTDLNGNSHISRFNVSSANPDSADPASNETLLFVTQPYTNHNGGDLHFGVDGYLYCSFGDGGLGGDPGNRAQNLQEYLGKMLRINVNVPHGYSIPDDNPFFNNPNANHEIWAYGLRNPWRNSFDRATHDFWIGDVGQGLYEEVDLQLASSAGGENYGWRCYEGDSTYDTSVGCGAISNYVFPVYAYAHGGVSCSVIGGYVYRGGKYGIFSGKYFLTDYCTGVITSLVPNGSGGWTATNEGNFNDFDFGTFGEDFNGELYIAGNSSGNIYKITSSDCTPAAFISSQDTIHFCGDTLVLSTPLVAGGFYAWYRNGVGVQASASNLLAVTQSGNYYVSVLALGGCSAISDTVYVDLQSAPAVSFSGLPTFMCSTQGAIPLSGSPAGGTFSGMGITGSAFNPATAGTGTHKITYSYLASSGCTATAVNAVAVESCLSVMQNEFVNDFKISPNPSPGKFILEFTAQKNFESKIEISDLTGKLCTVNAVKAVAGKNKIPFDLKNLDAGIYFLTMKSDAGTIAAKIVIGK
jgi:glucose/arabinose dehydrogenase